MTIWRVAPLVRRCANKTACPWLRSSAIYNHAGAGDRWPIRRFRGWLRLWLWHKCSCSCALPTRASLASQPQSTPAFAAAAAAAACSSCAASCASIVVVFGVSGCSGKHLGGVYLESIGANRVAQIGEECCFWLSRLLRRVRVRCDYVMFASLKWATILYFCARFLCTGASTHTDTHTHKTQQPSTQWPLLRRSRPARI